VNPVKRLKNKKIVPTIQQKLHLTVQFEISSKTLGIRDTNAHKQYDGICKELSSAQEFQKNCPIQGFIST
jgi:hypothetical protein